MVADVKIKANTIDVSNYIKKLQRTIPKDITKALNKVSAYAADQIQTKTQKGQTPDGGTFKQYSEAYKRSEQFKKKKNKFVDLTFHGHMFNSLTWKVRRTTSTLFFRRKSEQIKAYVHDEGVGQMPRRPFFAIGKKDENKIRDMFLRNIKL